MFGRGILGVLVTSGVIAGIGYMLMPRRRNHFSLRAMRGMFSQRMWNRIGRMMMRSVSRLAS